MEKNGTAESRLQICILAVICLVAAFAGNGVFLPDIMESRNIVTAREMVYDGNWLIPTMNGELRLEKPPLPTWITAAAEIISPDNLELMRGMAGAAALVLFFFFYRVAKDLLRVDAVASTLLFVTCYSVVLMAHTASWDIYCHAFMMGGIYFFGKGITSKGKQLWTFAFSGIMTGLSIMSKGPVSLFALFLPYLIALILCVRPRMKGKWGGVALMAVIALVVGCWWYAYIYIFHSDALSAVAAKESGAWMNRNVRPWYYYWKFFLEAGIWSLLLLTSLFLPLFHMRRSKGWELSAVWMLAALLLLSLMPEKKTRYLFPLLIPASYLMGAMIQTWTAEFRHRGGKKKDVAMMRINSWLLALAVGAVPFLAAITLYKDGFISVWLLSALSGACAVCCALLIASGVKLRPMMMVWSVALFFAVVEIFFLPAARPLINNPEMNSIARTREMSSLKGVDFYSRQGEELRIEMVYAAHRKIRPIDFSSADSMRKHLPMLVLSHKGASQELDPAIFQYADTLYIGHFDDNRRSVKSGKYNPTFIYHATLLTPKKTAR